MICYKNQLEVQYLVIRLSLCSYLFHTNYQLVVGISATMCHSAEKIPAKEGCQSKRVSKKQQIYPSRVFKYAPLGTTSTAQGSQRCPEVPNRVSRVKKLLA